MQFHFDLRLKNKICCHAINALNFAKTPSTKAINFTTYSNTTVEMTLHKIIITHITFIFTKRSFFKQFKHMMHNLVLITLNWLLKTLGRYSLPPLKKNLVPRFRTKNSPGKRSRQTNHQSQQNKITLKKVDVDDMIFCR